MDSPCPACDNWDPSHWIWSIRRTQITAELVTNRPPNQLALVMHKRAPSFFSPDPMCRSPYLSPTHFLSIGQLKTNKHPTRSQEPWGFQVAHRVPQVNPQKKKRKENRPTNRGVFRWLRFLKSTSPKQPSEQRLRGELGLGSIRRFASSRRWQGQALRSLAEQLLGVQEARCAVGRHRAPPGRGDGKSQRSELLS